MQVYQLQTENDEEETWRDLVRSVIVWRERDPIIHFIFFHLSFRPQSAHGFDRSLRLVATRREDMDVDEGFTSP